MDRLTKLNCMKHLLRFLPVLAVLLTACDKEAITPSGTITQVSHPFYTDYFQVQVSDGIQFNITPSDSDKVVIETDDNVQAEIYVKQIGNIIYINRKEGSDVKWDQTTVKAHIFTTQTISTVQAGNGSTGTCDYTLYGEGGYMKILLSSGSTFTSSVNLTGGSLWVELSGGSTANLSGKTKEMRLLSETGSTLNAYNLTTTNLILQIFSGGSTAYNTVTDKIFAVEAKGGSTLYYKGAATINPNSTFIEGASAVPVN